MLSGQLQQPAAGRRLKAHVSILTSLPLFQGGDQVVFACHLGIWSFAFGNEHNQNAL